MGRRPVARGEAVARLAAETARLLDLDDEAIERVATAAELRDIGKIAIPRQLLHKPSSLDADEWEFVRRHTLIGERIVSAAPALGGVAKLIRSSHERRDGTGYPDALAKLRRHAGMQFSPVVVDAFLRAVAQEQVPAGLVQR